MPFLMMYTPRGGSWKNEFGRFRCLRGAPNKHSPCDFTAYTLYFTRYSSVQAEAYYYRLPVPRVGDPAGATLRRTGYCIESIYDSAR